MYVGETMRRYCVMKNFETLGWLSRCQVVGLKYVEVGRKVVGRQTQGERCEYIFK